MWPTTKVLKGTYAKSDFQRSVFPWRSPYLHTPGQGWIMWAFFKECATGPRRGSMVRGHFVLGEHIPSLKLSLSLNAAHSDLWTRGLWAAMLPISVAVGANWFPVVCLICVHCVHQTPIVLVLLFFLSTMLACVLALLPAGKLSPKIPACCCCLFETLTEGMVATAFLS